MNAESMSSNECVALPSTSDEHPDPGDLIDERRHGGPERRAEEQAFEAAGPGRSARPRPAAARARPRAAAAPGQAPTPIVGAPTTEVQHRGRQRACPAGPRGRPGRSRRPVRRRPRRGCSRSRGARSVRPGRAGSRRSTPAPISGKVAPSSTDCGRIRALAEGPLGERERGRAGQRRVDGP